MMILVLEEALADIGRNTGCNPSRQSTDQDVGHTGPLL